LLLEKNAIDVDYQNIIGIKQLEVYEFIGLTIEFKK
jgi:hypothetical protein